MNTNVHAAQCARRAGFDGVEMHAANGYLLDQFSRDVMGTYGYLIQQLNRFGLATFYGDTEKGLTDWPVAL